MEINKKGGKLMKKLEIIIRPEKLEDLKENYDYVKDYLSKDEYQKLTESQRNQ